MKLVIAGGRDIEVPIHFMEACLKFYHLKPSLIIEGEQRGVDICAKRYAIAKGIPFDPNAADWTGLGKPAGPIRNKTMAKKGEALLLIWDGESSGSASMKREMLALGKPVYEIIIRQTVPQQTLPKQTTLAV